MSDARGQVDGQGRILRFLEVFWPLEDFAEQVDNSRW